MKLIGMRDDRRYVKPHKVSRCTVQDPLTTKQQRFVKEIDIEKGDTNCNGELKADGFAAIVFPF